MESFYLGCSLDFSETGKAIAEKAQTKLEEALGDDERRELAEPLKKLKYTNSDRAASYDTFFCIAIVE